MGIYNQVGVMKKSIVILLLCILQSACGHQMTDAGENSLLLSFEQLGAEISVSHEPGDDGSTPKMSSAL